MSAASRPLRVDLHTHTHRSSDCLTSFRALSEAARRRDIDVLAITDHNRIEGALEMSEIANGIRVIVGEEIMTSEGEIIGLFLRSFIPPRLSPEETVAEIRGQGGLVYVPHPFDRVRRGVLKRAALERIAHRIDLVEVINARIHVDAQNQEADRFASERGISRGAGSDAHTAYEVGRAGIEIGPFSDAASFREAARAARPFGRSSPPFVHLASTFAKVRKKYLPGWRWL